MTYRVSYAGLGKGKAKEEPKSPEQKLAEATAALRVSHDADVRRVAKTRKNFDIVQEFKKAQAKDNANFVVIGMYYLLGDFCSLTFSYIDSCRTC